MSSFVSCSVSPKVIIRANQEDDRPVGLILTRKDNHHMIDFGNRSLGELLSEWRTNTTR